MTERVIAAAIEVHKHLGPGLLESVYQRSLEHELSIRRIRFRKQVPVPVTYKGVAVGDGLRLDLLIEDLVIVEIKSVADLDPIHGAQLLTYMRLAHIPVGLLINFNAPRLIDGVTRKVLSELLPPSASSAPLR